MKRLPIFILLIFTTTLVFSFDFGLLHNQKIETGDGFLYNPDFTPWFSLNNKEGLSLNLSAFFSLKIDNEENTVFIPELSHFALTYRFGQNRSVEAGRLTYSDILGINATGLFDGVRINWQNLSGAFFYTGLLFKEGWK